ncbi:hypothetical protein PLEOSDRAFT_1089715 [Pleurotus ostreatus PC15]|uniref:Blue (type 1) copper domain-containing protein n=1 Tax=Pleurotus ostreatus (strain PC15) TaxID=1137138 RepID=A0A067NKA2_PLEO1|nr:hypothetical protein PLEOSDRAFT_1089715 [Pleurotus ostreatus PC15]
MRLLALALALVPAALAVDIPVSVGAENSFAFSPTSITAEVGDTVTFTFISRNHSATTTTFETPCPPPDGGLPGQFDTGFLSAIGGETPSVTIPITTTEPQFVACAQAAGGHCRIGMVMVINPTTEQTFDAFLANALAS